MRRLLLAAVVLAGAAGCDPCTGVAGCGDAPTPSVDGMILTTESGGEVSGARITLVRIAAGVRDSATTRSDQRGLFSVTLPTPGPGDQLALRVHSGAWPEYVIDSLPCAAPYRGGDGCVLDPILEVPRLPIYQIQSRVANGRGLGGARVTFVRRAGGTVFGKSATDSVTGTTSPDGFIQLFPSGVFGASLDPIVGDLSIEMPPPIGTMSRTGFQIRPIYTYKDRVAYVLAGPSLHYWLVFVDSATSKRLPGVEVEFARTGGVPTLSETARDTSDANGIADFLPVAQRTGTIEGTLRIRARPGLAAIDVGAISAATFDADTAVVFAKWLVGATGRLYPLPREGKP